MKIKQIVWAAMLIVLAPTVLHAQDKIITNLGVEIEAKVESYNSQIIFYRVLNKSDSILTDQVREVSKADGQRIVVIPKSQEGQRPLISDTDYLKALEENQASILLRSQTILKGVNFYTSRYLLTSTAQQELKKIANLFKKQKVTDLELVVHTDSSGKAINNLELSEKRAQNLKDFLVAQGLVGVQINATGKGEAEPIFGGKDQEALNRRVELKVLAIENLEILYSEKYVPPVVFANTPAATVLPEKLATETESIKQPKVKKSTNIKLSINSEVFSSKSNFFWVDYQPVSNRGKRPDLITSVLPPVGVYYERHIWRLAGFRGYASSHWWEENKILAESTTRQYAQLFRYKYWTLGGGPTLHFGLSPKWDTYIGMMVSFRWVRASCDCYALNEVSLSGDPFIGTRYFLGHRIFLTGEVGRHGTSYLKAGVGFKI